MDSNEYNNMKVVAKKCLSECVCKNKTDALSLKRIIKNDIKFLKSEYKKALLSDSVSYDDREKTEWLKNNFYAVEEKASEILHELKYHTFLQATYLKGERIPRFYVSFMMYISKLNTSLDEAKVDAFVNATEINADSRPDFSDLYSFEILFTGAVISAFASAVKTAGGFLNMSSELIGNFFISLKYMSVHCFEKSFEKSKTEELLRKDPLGFYSSMTVETKDYYRSRVAKLSKMRKISEADFAKEILEKSRAAAEYKKRHVGYYLYPQKTKTAGFIYFFTLFFLILLFVILLYSTLFSLKETGVFLQLSVLIVSVFPLWEASKLICDRVFAKLLYAPPIPSLELESIPDTNGVLVVVTTLLFGEKKDKQLFDKLEKMYLSCGMKNVYFGILGDFCDAEEKILPEDSKIYDYALNRISALNKKYNGSFYLFLRERSFCESEKIYMGYERKRGAVCDLTAFLVGRTNSFVKCDALMPESICQNIRYCITLDADTNMYADSVRKLCGIMLHPLNTPEYDDNGVVKEGIGIFQPEVCTELFSGRKTGFSRIFCSTTGIDVYSFSDYDIYGKLFGRSSFCGKGIFDKYAFEKAVNSENNSFPEKTVLSHDILEGARLGCVMSGDVKFTDGFPSNELSYLKRHHRWARGDFQNLLFLKERVKRNGKAYNNPTSALSRFKLFDNVRRESASVLSFILIVLSGFVPEKTVFPIFLAGTMQFIIPAVFDLISVLSFSRASLTVRRFFASGVFVNVYNGILCEGLRLGMLPAHAATTANAYARSFYRMFFSKRKMLEWVTASESERDAGELLSYVSKNLFGAIIGTLLFIFSNNGFVKLCGFLWFVFPVVLYFLSKEKESPYSLPKISESEKTILKDYVADMWKYFSENTGVAENYIPPDNVQLSPTRKTAHRTSPTNIGLYLLSIIAARDFGLITTEEMYEKTQRFIRTIGQLQKHEGLLYNWYDTRTLKVLEEKYVSSVDCGNYLACLVAAKEGLLEYVNEKPELLDICLDIEKQISESNVEKLYNKRRELFSFGIVFEGDKEKLLPGCFDMLMSEARTLSFFAVAKRKIPYKHYFKLSRNLVKANDRIGVSSWTGTAFEYFMPALFMPTVKGSLMYEALRFSFFLQRKRKGKGKKSEVFGISESCYNEYDNSGNYCYKAFGIPVLGVKAGLEKDLVISPYSSFLFLPLNVPIPLENLNKIKNEGGYGEYGFYEAFDFTGKRGGKHGKFVKCYMSHHVGMSIIAAANACMDGIFVKRFMRDKMMQSVSELFEEKIPTDAPVRKVSVVTVEEKPKRSL